MHHTLARFAPAKINLFLEVLGRRPDGYHEIATVMEAIGAGDPVEVGPHHELIVTSTRPDVPSGPGNVAYKIVRAAEEALARPLPARITIVKHVPPGSGLGGGSSDAVSALLLVLALHGVAAPPDVLAAIAAKVGSDTAFFLTGGAALCTGRGEIVRLLATRGVRHLVLVFPGFECTTAKVYAALEIGRGEPPQDPSAVIAALERGSTLASGPDAVLPFNRLAAAAEWAYPDLAGLRERLEDITGRHPHLSGSGSTFLFLCPSQADAKALAETVRTADPALEVRQTASYR